MKKLTFVILMICSSRIYAQTICEGQQVVPIVTFNQCNTNPWVLVFEESFNGSSLDLSRWNYGPRIRYCGPEQQYYTSGNNIEVSNGTLKLIAKKETVYARAVDWLPDDEHLYCDGVDRGQNARYFYYTSGNIETNKKFSYGKYEARIKIAKGKGFWPAFWMYGGDPVYNEIDVFEFWNQDNIWGNYDPSLLSKVHNMTIHFDFDGDGNRSMCHTKYTGVDFSQDFHVFTLIWEKNKIEWYVDGSLKRTDYRYYTILGQTTGCTINAWGQYILNKIYTRDPMHIILNFAIQSGSDSPESSTVFPSQMEVDWVRYYQRNPCQDVNITDASQYPLDNQLYNVIVGEDVNINCDYTIPSGQQLDIVAKNSITLEPGFSTELGSIFSARIEPTVCGSSLKSASVDNFQDTISTNKDIETQFTDKTFLNEDIQIFPNPNEGCFIVDFGSKDYKNYNIVITQIEGKLIKSFKELNSSTINIDLSGNIKGVYVLYLLNNQDKSITTHKIILQ
jgi:beta-glucanase (GH16 family)